MAKAQRELNAKLRLVNTVVEVVDARMPQLAAPASGNLDWPKQHVIALTKIDLADAADTRAWKKQLQRSGPTVIGVDAVKGQGIKALLAAIGKQNRPSAGSRGPQLRKSSLINRCGRSAARVGATGHHPPAAVVTPMPNIEFLDTPGLLWPKIENLLQALKRHAGKYRRKGL